MAEHIADPDLGVMSGIDFQAFWETLKLRWWVIPVVVGVAVGFLWAQESDLRTEPGSYFVSRTYEARDSTAVLASVGIDPVSVRSFPDANNQLLVLQSAAVRQEISAALGSEVTVNVSRTRPTFTLIDTLESDGQSSFVFQSAGVPTYSFNCTEPAKATCIEAIDAYAAKAVEIRRDALRAGLDDLKAVLTSVQESAPNTDVATKLAALEVLIDRLDTPLLQIAEYEEAIGSTLSSVRRPTYTFGVAAGILVSLLILLQLTFADSRVRSMRQLVRLAGMTQSLGHLTAVEHAIRDRRTAVSLHHELVRQSAKSIRFLPVHFTLDETAPLQRLAAMTAAESTFSRPFAELSVIEFSQRNADEVDVVVVRRNRDMRKDVVEVLAALAHSDRNVAGVLLFD